MKCHFVRTSQSVRPNRFRAKIERAQLTIEAHTADPLVCCDAFVLILVAKTNEVAPTFPKRLFVLNQIFQFILETLYFSSF